MNAKLLAAVALWVGLLAATGCGKKAAHNHDDEDHSHGNGPHGGVLFDLGKYHAEFKPDHAKKEVTVWLLGGDAKAPARAKVDKLRLVVTNTNPKIEIDLMPTDANEDGASTFTGTHEGFGTEMEYQGTVSMDYRGKTYTAEFKEEPAKK